MPSSPNINSDSTATFTAYAELATKVDVGTTVPDGDLDTTPGANLFNFYDTLHEQANAVFRGSRYCVIPQVQGFWGSWTSGVKSYLDPIGTTETTSSTFAKELVMPCGGWLQRVTFYQSATGGNTDVYLHKNGVDSTAVTVSSVASATSYHADFGSAFAFAKGDRVTIGIDPTDASGPGNIQATAVFMLDFTTL